MPDIVCVTKKAIIPKKDGMLRNAGLLIINKPNKCAIFIDCEESVECARVLHFYLKLQGLHIMKSFFMILNFENPPPKKNPSRSDLLLIQFSNVSHVLAGGERFESGGSRTA